MNNNLLTKSFIENLDKDDLIVIKNSLESYYFEFDGNDNAQKHIGYVEKKINQIMEAL
jgi:hypothetical protein